MDINKETSQITVGTRVYILHWILVKGGWDDKNK